MSNYLPTALICLTNSTTIALEALNKTVSMLKIFAGLDVKASQVLDKTSEPCSTSFRGASFGLIFSLSNTETVGWSSFFNR